MLKKYEVIKFYHNLGASSSSLLNIAECSVGDDSTNDESKSCL